MSECKHHICCCSKMASEATFSVYFFKINDKILFAVFILWLVTWLGTQEQEGFCSEKSVQEVLHIEWKTSKVKLYPKVWNWWWVQSLFVLKKLKSKDCVIVWVRMCVCPCLSEFFQWLLRPKDKLQRDVFAVTVRPTAGAQNVLCYFLQRGRADEPRVSQRRNDLILQQPPHLKHTERKSTKGLSQNSTMSAQ